MMYLDSENLKGAIWVPHIILGAILASTVVAVVNLPYLPDLSLWHIVTLVIAVAYWRIVVHGAASNWLYGCFLVYIALHGIIDAVLTHSNAELIAVLRRMGLFFSSFSVFLIFIFISRKSGSREHLDQFFILTVVVTSLAGYYQLLARAFDLPLGVLAQQDFRTGFITQNTSLFTEPRFYSLFVVVCLYIVLFVRHAQYRVFLASLLVISGLLTMSLTAYVLLLLVLLLYVARFKLVRSSGHVKIRYFGPGLKAFGALAIIIASTLYVFHTADLVVGRLSRAFFEVPIEEHFERALSEDPLTHVEGMRPLDPVYRHYSAYMSTFGELSFSVKTWREHPIVGYGIGYDKHELGRTLGLNGFTEATVRWGGIGLLLFAGCCLSGVTKLRRERLSFPFFVIALVSAHGSIAEPFFWFSLGLLHAYKEMYLVNEQRCGAGWPSGTSAVAQVI